MAVAEHYSFDLFLKLLREKHNNVLSRIPNCDALNLPTFMGGELYAKYKSAASFIVRKEYSSELVYSPDRGLRNVIDAIVESIERQVGFREGENEHQATYDEIEKVANLLRGHLHTARRSLASCESIEQEAKVKASRNLVLIGAEVSFLIGDYAEAFISYLMVLDGYPNSELERCSIGENITMLLDIMGFYEEKATAPLASWISNQYRIDRKQFVSKLRSEAKYEYGFEGETLNKVIGIILNSSVRTRIWTRLSDYQERDSRGIWTSRMFYLVEALARDGASSKMMLTEISRTKSEPIFTTTDFDRASQRGFETISRILSNSIEVERKEAAPGKSLVVEVGEVSDSAETASDIGVIVINALTLVVAMIVFFSVFTDSYGDVAGKLSVAYFLSSIVSLGVRFLIKKLSGVRWDASHGSSRFVRMLMFWGFVVAFLVLPLLSKLG